MDGKEKCFEYIGMREEIGTIYIPSSPRHKMLRYPLILSLFCALVAVQVAVYIMFFINRVRFCGNYTNMWAYIGRISFNPLAH